MIYLIRPHGLALLHPQAPRPSCDDIGCMIYEDTGQDELWALVTMHELLLKGIIFQMFHAANLAETQPMNPLVTAVLRHIGAEAADFQVFGTAVVLSAPHLLTRAEAESFSGQGWGHA